MMRCRRCRQTIEPEIHSITVFSDILFHSQCWLETQPETYFPGEVKNAAKESSSQEVSRQSDLGQEVGSQGRLWGSSEESRSPAEESRQGLRAFREKIQQEVADWWNSDPLAEPITAANPDHRPGAT